MKVKCTNESCRDYNQIRETEDWDGMDSFILLKRITCPLCGTKGEIIPEERQEETKGFGGVGFGIISSLNPQEKKAFLKKRSNEHYKREIKPKKEYMDRQFFGKEQ